jgi:hypothetical protein
MSISMAEDVASPEFEHSLPTCRRRFSDSELLFILLSLALTTARGLITQSVRQGSLSAGSFSSVPLAVGASSFPLGFISPIFPFQQVIMSRETAKGPAGLLSPGSQTLSSVERE